MKKILFISAFPPSNRTAGQNYTALLLDDISKDNEIDLLYWDFLGHSPIIPPRVKVIDSITLTKVQRIYHSVISFLLFPLFTVRYSWNVCRKLRAIAAQYDIVYFDFSQVFLYSLFISHPCKVLMCHDVITQKFSRKKWSFIYLWYVRFTENLLLHTANKIMCFSRKDANFINDEFGLDAYQVNFYINDKIKNVDLNETETGNYFIMFGAWNRPENYEGLLWFCNNVLPESDIKCIVIGGGMSESIRQKIECDKCRCLGFVEDPYPYIASAACLIAPIFQGAGVKVKVIESLALGTPIIGTDIAFEGIDDITYAGSKSSLILSNTKDEFVDNIKTFMLPSKRDKIEIKDTFFRTYQSNSFKSIMKSL